MNESIYMGVCKGRTHHRGRSEVCHYVHAQYKLPKFHFRCKTLTLDIMLKRKIEQANSRSVEMRLRHCVSWLSKPKLFLVFNGWMKYCVYEQNNVWEWSLGSLFYTAYHLNGGMFDTRVFKQIEVGVSQDKLPPEMEQKMALPKPMCSSVKRQPSHFVSWVRNS